MGQGAQDASKESTTTSTALQATSLKHSDTAVLITCIECDDTGEMFFSGKEDGSVYVHDIESGRPIQQLFSHAHGVAIVSLQFGSQSHTLSSVDSSSRIMIHKLLRQQQSMVVTEVLFNYRADTAVGQLLCQLGLQRKLVCLTRSNLLWSLSPNNNLLLTTANYKDGGLYR